MSSTFNVLGRLVLAACTLAACEKDYGSMPAPTSRCPGWKTCSNDPNRACIRDTDCNGTCVEHVTPATGTFSITIEGVEVPGDAQWIVGVEDRTRIGQSDVVINACVPEVIPCDNDFEAPYWERWRFAGTYRLAGPIDERTQIPAATAVGIPGMAAGVGNFALTCGDKGEITVEPAQSWLAGFNGVAELFVDRWSSAAGTLVSDGWLNTDAPTHRIDLDIDVTW
jgi:hypothetical protein